MKFQLVWRGILVFIWVVIGILTFQSARRNDGQVGFFTSYIYPYAITVLYMIVEFIRAFMK